MSSRTRVLVISHANCLIGNYAAFFWAAICFCCIIYTYFRIPEPRGRSFAEVDLLFERGVSARKFATTEVDVFEDDEVSDAVRKSSFAEGASVGNTVLSNVGEKNYVSHRDGH